MILSALMEKNPIIPQTERYLERHFANNCFSLSSECTMKLAWMSLMLSYIAMTLKINIRGGQCCHWMHWKKARGERMEGAFGGRKGVFLTSHTSAMKSTLVNNHCNIRTLIKWSLESLVKWAECKVTGGCVDCEQFWEVEALKNQEK